jgi:hypothetical protein
MMHTALTVAALKTEGILAQTGGLEVKPTTDGPGAVLVGKVIGWLTFYGLAGAIMSCLMGGMVWGLAAHYGNGMHAGKGRGLVMGGAIGAGVIGLTTTIVKTLFNG